VPLGPNVEPPLFIPRSEALFTAPRTKSSFRAGTICILRLLWLHVVDFCSLHILSFTRVLYRCEYWFLFSRASRLNVSSDEKLFNKILTCPNRILRTLLPPPTAQNYSLQNRPHNRQLPDRISRITDCNFTVGMLYRIMYQIIYILALRFSYSCLQLRFDSS